MPTPPCRQRNTASGRATERPFYKKKGPLASPEWPRSRCACFNQLPIRRIGSSCVRHIVTGFETKSKTTYMAHSVALMRLTSFLVAVAVDGEVTIYGGRERDAKTKRRTRPQFRPR